MAAGAIVLGILSFLDFLKACKGNLKEMSLQLPGVIKSKIHNKVKESASSAKHVVAAFIAGITISILELACTGQVYLPTIIFVTSRKEMRQAGLTYLLLYNIMFILPLTGIFIVAYKGTTSEKLASLAKAHVIPVKLVLAILFLGMGMLLTDVTHCQEQVNKL